VWRRSIITRGNWLLALGSGIGVYETVGLLPGAGQARYIVYGFALAIMGLKWTLPEKGDPK